MKSNGSDINRMKPYCSVQAWRIKLVLSVVMIIFARSKAGGTLSEDVNPITDVTEHHKQQTGKFLCYIIDCDKTQQCKFVLVKIYVYMAGY
jgi:hypothetical protein